MANKIINLIKGILPKCFFGHVWIYNQEMVVYTSISYANEMSFNTHIRYCSVCHKKQAERIGMSGNDWFDVTLNNKQERDKKIDEII